MSKAPTVDIGILTIRDDEFRALLDVFPSNAGIYRGRTREYTLRYAEAGPGWRYTVAMLRQIEQGNGEAQDAARDLIDDLDPALLLVVGIAAGLPSDDVTLGDVIVSTRINDYSVEARKAKSLTTYNLSGGPIAKSIAAGVANLAGREADLGSWTESLPTKPRVSWNRTGQLYGSKSWQQNLSEKLQTHFGRGVKPRNPRFMAGTIASSDRLVKDPKVLFPWIETARHILAVEMESGGVYRAARERCPMLAIRGISDLVGLQRSEDWTKYACASAAAFARAYLRTQPVQPRSPSESGGSTTNPTGHIGSRQTTVELLYVNLVPLIRFPPTTYIAPATCSTMRQAWGILLGSGARHYIPRAWALHNNVIYSFNDPTTSPLKSIVDTGGIECHDTMELALTSDVDHCRIFVQLLNGALYDDLRTMGVLFFFKDNMYAFAGSPDAPPRKYTYQNVRQQSTMTVVPHYAVTSKDGRIFPHLRHLAFIAGFRRKEGQWLLEITPTYRYTTDGKQKHKFHTDMLRRIKRIEGNRAVLSQVLLWNAVLSASPPPGENPKMLTFGRSPTFPIASPIADDQLTAIDSKGAVVFVPTSLE